MAFKLKKDDYIICAYASPASGPGWANQPVYVVFLRNGSLMEECIQPEEQNRDMQVLYSISAAANGSMIRAVEKLVGR